jgi:hypothetical protein
LGSGFQGAFRSAERSTLSLRVAADIGEPVPSLDLRRGGAEVVWVISGRQDWFAAPRAGKGLPPQALMYSDEMRPPGYDFDHEVRNLATFGIDYDEVCRACRFASQYQRPVVAQVRLRNGDIADNDRARWPFENQEFRKIDRNSDALCRRGIDALVLGGIEQEWIAARPDGSGGSHHCQREDGPSVWFFHREAPDFPALSETGASVRCSTATPRYVCRITGLDHLAKSSAVAIGYQAE